MAETIQEPIYIYYGNDQIELAPLMKALADDVSDYVNSLSWSRKRKLRFMDAYSDIVSNEIIGANNKSGEWEVDLRKDIGSKKDLEIYQNAAHYILQLMKKVPIKSSKEEENKKADLKLYDNAWHQKALTGYIGNNMFGGRNWDYTKDWDVLDKRDEKTGILGTSRRMSKLADMLEGYGNSLEEGKYNFEGTAFKDLNDLKTRINNAVTTLRRGVMDLSVIDSLNAIGIDYRTYLHNGSEDIVGQDANGNPITRSLAIEALLKAELEKAAQEAALKKQQALAVQKTNSGVLNLINGIHAVEARSAASAYANYLANQYGVGLLGFNKINTTIQGLIEKGYSGGLSAKDKKQLGNLLYYIRTNNPNYLKSNVSDLEWAELNTHKNLGSLNRTGFVRLPWQTSDGKYTFADDKGNLYFLKPKNLKQLGSVPIIKSAAYNLYKQNFLKSERQIKNDAPLSKEDTDIIIADGVSMLGDIVSLFGGYAGLGGGVVSLGFDVYSDIRRGKDTRDVVWNAIKNLGWTAAGVVPGIKSLKIVNRAARIFALANSLGIAMNSDVHNSWKKLISGQPISSHDFENYKYTLHALSGGVNAARGHLVDKNVTKALGKNKIAVKTKAGIKYITEKLQKEINSAGERKGLKAADELFQKYAKAEAVDGLYKFSENGRRWYNPTRYSAQARKVARKATDSDEKPLSGNKTIDAGEVKRLLDLDKNKPIFANPFKAQTWKDFITPGGSNRGAYTMALKNANTSTTEEEPTTTTATTSLPPRPPHISPKDFGLPKNINLNAYFNNRVGNNPAITRKTSTRFINKGKDYASTIDFGNGEQLNIRISSKGDLIITDTGGNTVKNHKLNNSNYAFDAKKQIGETVNNYRKQLISSKKIRRQFTKEFIESLKRNSLQGLLFKLGGVILQDLNTIIHNFLKNENKTLKYS